ncbi:MAG: class I SAM-dependent methyltransferase [Rhodobacteraceae bacterium]|nr:class I SAM-dependent methyltransferase [Paracoccaceae bacterium]
MSDNTVQFVGSIPTYYDTGLGPNIFYDYADALAKICSALGATNVVELAAGTGIVSRRLRDALSPDARLVVTDLNGPMLDVAKSKFSDQDKVEFLVANAMTLPFEDAEFDLMVCQFGVMFFPDKPDSFREAARVLKSGGHYVFNTWGPMSKNPYSVMAYDVTARFFPTDPPGFYKVPFHYSDPVKVLGDLSTAGWTDVEHTTLPLSKTIVDPKAFAHAIVYGNPLVDEIRQRGGVDPDDVVSAVLDGLLDTFGPAPLVMPLQSTTFVCRVA